MTPAEVLGPGGLLAERMSAYESRPQQLAMADTVARAIAEGGHAIVEAPTGVGKSFAYLVPLALHALEGEHRVVISTGTIALQEQLIRKDIPLLQELFPGLKAVLVKGRQNYLSIRRLKHALESSGSSQQALFETREDAAAVKEIADWSGRTEIGDIADLGYDPPPAVWRQVVSDRNNCLGRKCPTYDECFFYKARKEMEGAHLLVVNHHLYFSDLSLRGDHAAILPAHDVVVFDEAHTLEDVATDHMGTSVSEAQVRFFLDGLWSRKSKGLFGDERFAFAREACEHARAANEGFWKEVCLLAGDSRDDAIKLPSPHMVENTLSPALDLLTQRLDGCAARAGEENLLHELKAQQAKAVAMSGAIRAIVGQLTDGHVYYAHVPQSRERGGRGSPSLSASPLSVAELLKVRLFDETRTVVLTSATLAADDSDRFLFLRRRLGLEGGLAQRLDSPFDFTTQAKMVLNRSPIDPGSERYERALALWLSDYLSDPGKGRVGGSFVLFTSYRQLKAVHDFVRPALDRANRFVLRHGDGLGRAQMLDLFKRVGDAVLFGTSSFWEGVDVPGDALKHVIITKLPFEVPNHPVVEARHHEIERRGGNAFMERTVPEAIIRLKQGFGRLIRTRTDTGTVAILDHRVLTKAYGRYFLKALPSCELEVIDLAKWAGGQPAIGDGADYGAPPF
jgi:ATP-dependent DNA helicase DinG